MIFTPQKNRKYLQINTHVKLQLEIFFSRQSQDNLKTISRQSQDNLKTISKSNFTFFFSKYRKNLIFETCNLKKFKIYFYTF
jgi:hypothetical protein